MEHFRHYLGGKKFTSWGDHEPLLPYYHNLTKSGSVCLIKHRQKIQDLVFTDKYLAGKENPSNYASRQPKEIRHLTERQTEEAGVDDRQEIHVLRVLFRDLPEAVTIDMVKEAASLDPKYQQMTRALQRGLRRAEEGLKEYGQVWSELGLMDGIVCKVGWFVSPKSWPIHPAFFWE